MHVDTSIPGRIVIQPETGVEQAVLHAMQDRLKGLVVPDTAALLAYFTADIIEYPGLDAELHDAADYWKEPGYRALVITWRK